MTGPYTETLLLGSLVLLLAIAVVGGWIAYRAGVAYRARRTRPMLFLGAGLFVIAVGTPGLWTATYLVTDNLLWCSLMAFGGLLVGLILVLSSLRTRGV